MEGARFERLLALVKRVSARTDSDLVPLLVAASDSKGLRLSDDALLDLSSLLDGSPDKDPHGHETDERKSLRPQILMPDSLDAGSIRAAFEASLDRNDVLSFMNRTKNAESRRWVALPLRLKHESVEFRGCLRLLLHESQAARESNVEGLVLDVISPARKWSFVIAGEFKEGSILSVYSDPPFGEGKGESAVDMERLLRDAVEPTGLKVSVSGSGTTSGIEGRIEGYAAVDVEA
jgi:hypothetical protein